MVAHEHNKSSQGQEDFVPDNPLEEAVVGLWYDASVPKPNIKVVFIQTTLIFFTDCSWHPYGIPRPFLNPAADVVGCIDIHHKAQELHVPEGAMVAAIHPTLLRGAIHHRGAAGDGHCLHKLGVHDLAFVIPLQGMNCMNRCYLAQRAG